MQVEIVPGIVADPEIASGRPLIAGTRVPPALVVAQLRAGVPEHQLCADYDLRHDQIGDALTFVAHMDRELSWRRALQKTRMPRI